MEASSVGEDGGLNATVSNELGELSRDTTFYRHAGSSAKTLLVL